MRIIIDGSISMLVFNSTDEMKQFSEQISGQAEWAEKGHISPPYIYATFNQRIDPDEVKKTMEDIKQRFTR